VRISRGICRLALWQSRRKVQSYGPNRGNAFSVESSPLMRKVSIYGCILRKIRGAWCLLVSMK
jgi:hypothetical protein